MDNNNEYKIDLKKIPKLHNSGMIWPILLVILIAFTAFKTFRFGTISNTQAGVVVNKITGNMNIFKTAGEQLYNGFYEEFFVIDTDLQELEMTMNTNKGDRRGDDSLNFKSADGSSVKMDLTVNYRIATMSDINSCKDILKEDIANIPTTNEEAILRVFETSGLDGNYKLKWLRDYTRSICRDTLGELSTEDIYDSAKRIAQLKKSEMMINKKLLKFGIYVDKISAKKPDFPTEYEQLIDAKTVTRQAVTTETSKATTAISLQDEKIEATTKKAVVEITKYETGLKKLKINALAEAEKFVLEAETYELRLIQEADAELYVSTKKAEEIFEKRSKEAQGIKELNKALSGIGGRNLVKLEYARRLKGIKIKGVPYSKRNVIEQLQHLYNDDLTPAKKGSK